MLQIGDKLVSLDLVERWFCCDLDACHGDCCIEGDAGAPITKEEYQKIKELVPVVWDRLTPRAQEEIARRGVGYIDQEGDLVTTIVDDRDCVFTCYAPGGMCQCALEKAFEEGKSDFRKPASCYLYPVRVKKYPTFTAVNYHRWKICRPAEALGRKLGIRLYQFLKEPLIAEYGQEWYDELCLICEEYLRQYPSD
ncbi:MAG: DUF3109 family protein [Bacteroidales bacterium]|nr:DUF3109 family protein [Bacteroidales bacterium]